MRTLRSTLLAVAVAVLAGTLGTGTALADTVVIDSVDSPLPAYSPPNVTIHKGDTVRFEFDAAMATHTGDTVRFEFDSATRTHTLTSSSPDWTVNEVKSPGGRRSRTRSSAPVRTRSCAPSTAG